MFEVADGVLLGPNRAQLLRQIAQGQSIIMAAASIGIEINHAMDLIERINESASQHLVEILDREKQRARVTEVGMNALADYDAAFNGWHRLTMMELQNIKSGHTACEMR
ncbi:MAG TPA: hypothetical protein VLH56_02255 [Dissulfurispiraceae bacterium]|nr:hypothetical protein [Dissulfurispiraceae bacterium]